MAKIARQRRRVEKQPDKVDMGYTHDVALYNVNLFTGTSFQQRAYVSAPQMASRDCFFFLHFCTQTEKNVARTVDGPHPCRRRSDTHGKNVLQLDAQRTLCMRKPLAAPRFSSTRAPMPLEDEGGFRVPP